MDKFNQHMALNEEVLAQLDGEKKAKALDLLQQLRNLLTESDPAVKSEPPAEDNTAASVEKEDSCHGQKSGRRKRTSEADSTYRRQTPVKTYPPERPVTRSATRTTTAVDKNRVSSVKPVNSKHTPKEQKVIINTHNSAVSRRCTAKKSSTKEHKKVLGQAEVTQVIKVEGENVKDASKDFETEASCNPVHVKDETSFMLDTQSTVQENMDKSDTHDESSTAAAIIAAICPEESTVDQFEKRDGSWWCRLCGRKFNSRANVKVHIRTHTGEKPYHCDICNRSFAVKVNYSRHLKRHEKELPFVCMHCPKKYAEERHLRQHVQSNHIADPVTGETKYSRQSVKGKVCHQCGKNFASPYYLRVHMRVHSGDKPHVCRHCGRRFRSGSNLTYHLRHVHRQLETPLPFTCDTCNSGFVTVGRLCRHRKMYHSLQALERRRIAESNPEVNRVCRCTICDKVFTSRQKLMVHKRDEHDKYYECDQCCERFVWQYLLTEHLATHGRKARFTCVTCGQSFSRAATLKQHKAVHGGAKSYRCSICGREYLYQSSLRLHEAGHHSPTQQPHVCTQCSRSFTLAAGLRRHMAYHRGNKLHMCDCCTKAFVTKGDLQRHRKTHSRQPKVTQGFPTNEVSQPVLSTSAASQGTSDDISGTLVLNTVESLSEMGIQLVSESSAQEGSEGAATSFVCQAAGEIANVLVTLSETQGQQILVEEEEQSLPQNDAGQSCVTMMYTDQELVTDDAEAAIAQTEMKPSETVLTSPDKTSMFKCEKCHATFANEYASSKHAKFCVGAMGSQGALTSILQPSLALATQNLHSADKPTVIKLESADVTSSAEESLMYVCAEEGDCPVIIAIQTSDLDEGMKVSVPVVQGQGEEELTSHLAKAGEIANALVTLSQLKVDNTEELSQQQILLPQDATFYQQTGGSEVDNQV